MPEAFWWDSFFQRYHWTYADVRKTPEPLLDELFKIMEGEAKGARLARAKRGTGSHTPIDDGADESAAAYAARRGLPMPPGGWPVPVRDAERRS